MAYYGGSERWTASEGKKETHIKMVADSKDVDHLVGQILTLTDAAFSDKEQRTAQKTLLKQTIHKWAMTLYQPIN